jgi:hypothetical protein
MVQQAEIVDIRRLRAVKWSRIEKEVGTFRDAIVKTFLKYEGCPLLDEDGTALLDRRGGHREVTVTSFAERMGVDRNTLQDWVFARRGYSPHPNSRVRTTVPDTGTNEEENPPASEPARRSESHGRCSHCPRWEEEK